MFRAWLGPLACVQDLDLQDLEKKFVELLQEKPIQETGV